jgi:hypothetical protein
MAQSDIIVVGGGPVGLFTAAELAVRGLTVIVYEKRLKRTAHSRGLAFHGRSLDIKASRGLLQQFLDHGVKVPVTHYGGLQTMVFINKLDVRFVITPLENKGLLLFSSLAGLPFCLHCFGRSASSHFLSDLAHLDQSQYSTRRENASFKPLPLFLRKSDY